MSGFVQAVRGLPLSSRAAAVASVFLRVFVCLITLVQGTLAIIRRVFGARYARRQECPSQRLRVSALGVGLALYSTPSDQQIHSSTFSRRSGEQVGGCRLLNRVGRGAFQLGEVSLTEPSQTARST
jgi:hypothetical protein